MKTITALFIFLLVSFSAFSQTVYEQAMHDGLDSLKHIKVLEDFQSVTNHFERIAAAEPGQWLPRYYAAYCRIILSFKEQEKEKKEQLLVKSENLLNGALKISPEESELFALQGMLYQGFIMLDPQNNAPEYSARANQSFDRAITLNASNPRPYYLKGMNLMYMPEPYGGGMKAACPLFAKAKELFETFVKADELMPDWGKDQNEQLLEKCAN
jgi:hypothetical protein